MAEHSGNGHDDGGISGTAAAAALAERTLAGDLRDFMIDVLRRQRNIWSLLNEQQQTNLVLEIAAEVDVLIGRAVNIIAARNFTAVGVALEQVTFKPKGTEAKLVFGTMASETRHQLADAQGGRVVIVMADPDTYRGARGLAAIDRDQPELPIETGAAPAPYEIDPGEIAGDFAPPADLDSLAPEPDDQTGYRAGYTDGLDGIAWGNGPYPDNSSERARYEAGWWTAWIERISDPHERTEQTDEARNHFIDMGRTAAAAGSQPTDCPFPEWMLARDWWNEGFFAEDDTPRPKPRRRGKGASGEGTTP